MEEIEKSIEEEVRSAVISVLNCKPEEFAKKYSKYKKAKAEFEEMFEPVKDAIIQVHAGRTDLPKSIIIGGVELTYVSPSVRNSIDSKKLKEEEPELAKKFTKATTVNASVRINGI